jgi:hypothetical protein
MSKVELFDAFPPQDDCRKRRIYIVIPAVPTWSLRLCVAAEDISIVLISYSRLHAVFFPHTRKVEGGDDFKNAAGWRRM